MQIIGQLPNEYVSGEYARPPKTETRRRTEASEFDSGSDSGNKNSPYRQPERQQNPGEENEQGLREQSTLPAIKPGVGASGSVMRRDVPSFSDANIPGADDPVSPLPMLRRRSEAYERMLNIF